MKNYILFFVCLLCITVGCKKNTSLPTSNTGGEINWLPPPPPPSPQLNRPPIANAGPDQTILSSVAILNGSNSSDSDNNIVSYLWTKISGPSSFNTANANAVQTQVMGLVQGVYQFELKVTDAGGLSDKDTVQVTVIPPQQNQGKVHFYFPDPTATMPCLAVTFDNPAPTLMTVTVTNYGSQIISGVWCHDYQLGCSDYNTDPGDVIDFNLPPGTYHWIAESAGIDLSNYLLVTPAFLQYMLIPHRTEGTITVNPGDSCIIQKIVF